MLKPFAALTLCAGLFAGWCSTNLCSGQTYLTGQAARAVIGQATFDGQVSGTSDSVFGGIGGLAYANDTLFATDANRLGFLPNNNRVVVFNNIQQMIPADNAEIPPYTGRCPVCGGRASLVIGQPDFTSAAQITPPTQLSLRIPTAVATDGKILAIADTANNRILIWHSIPTVNGLPADTVLGQVDFATVARNTVTATTMRGPQGVWIQNGRLFVADTQNNRILIWNSIPSQNNRAADVVLGQPNFNTAPPIDQTNTSLPTSANIMLSPVSVTSDGTHLFVADLGYNRVLIWDEIPTQNNQNADVEVGQLNFTNSIANDASEMCASNGTDSSGNPTYPSLCAATMNFPRYVLSDGTRLYIADGGNDRVLVYNQIPTQNGVRADVILGEPDEFSDVYTNSNGAVVSAANVTPTPTSLAWDGSNLYVADPTDYRVLIFTPEQPLVPINNVVNAASLAVYAVGSIGVSGTITAKDVATLTINGTAYNYTVLSTDTTDTVAKGLVAAIDAANNGTGDPSVFVYEKDTLSTILVVARQPGVGSSTATPLTGNNITIATSTSASATIVLTTSGATLSGGGSAAQLAPGTILFVNGTNLADAPASASTTAAALPFELGGVELYIDGMQAPLFSVSPTQIKAVLPWAVIGSVSVTSWLRIVHADGSVTVTDPVNIPVVDANPGIFADTTPGATEPRAATAVHGSSFATATIVIGGGIQAGDSGTITVNSINYTYPVTANDTPITIRDGLVAIINGSPSAPVVASAANEGFTIRLRAKVPGPAGEGISVVASVSTVVTTGAASLSLTATNSVTCCSNVAGSPVTVANPAVPGETIIIYATGLGMIYSTALGGQTANDPAHLALIGRDGAPYNGPAANTPVADVSVSAAAASGTIISSSLVPGMISMYQVVIELPTTLPPDAQAQLTISQEFNTSNIVTIPVAEAPQQ